MCPYKLRMMVDAVKRSAADNAVRFAAFLDTGATFMLRRHFTRGGPERLDDVQINRSDPNTRFDMSDQPDSSGRPALWYFWDAAIQPWFDTIPRHLWLTVENQGIHKPMIIFWEISPRFTNQRGNAANLLISMKELFKTRYGIEPFFVVSSSWIATDPTLVEHKGLVGGVHDCDIAMEWSSMDKRGNTRRIVLIDGVGRALLGGHRSRLQLRTGLPSSITTAV
ncbi:hypothetical protein DAPPUDRAFT_122256 [Daphnia pulex]|uniref:DUF5010 domain-containing protein n=1 Tax=Daphnia pulex TaxID=6669 RepID=E9I3V4_DAPPU|nr:hypothetical protein DAPPUDRAFT_122256 [Daphnia pulex]|eukprot:EFX61326.1 hypothetical protein DAPPUDRAFT_122256 [Daphnia pulex]